MGADDSQSYAPHSLISRQQDLTQIELDDFDVVARRLKEAQGIAE